MNKFHPFPQSVSRISLPEKFTYPFHYTPHPLCVMAAEEVQTYLEEKEEWKKELENGKMFGVLVVRTDAGEIGFLAAFSGILGGRNLHAYFVPPVYDLQKPDGFFLVEEEQISAINVCIRQLSEDKNYIDCKQRLSEETVLAQQTIEEAKRLLKEAKEIRENQRRNNPDEGLQAALIRESQFQKAELKRLKQYWNNRIISLQAEVKAYETEIEKLKTERKKRSAALQQKLFEQFRMLNARGEIRSLCDIFKDTVQKIPPAGAGECAAPKLLQYAYSNGLRPIAMAEFWWGNSPKTEIRKHGLYYPACKGKCEPILKHMLQGLDVETNPLSEDLCRDTELEIVWEDSYLLVVNKPAGMLSVPGKLGLDSVYRRLRSRYPEATGPMIVHRLDMATSGLLLVAKTKEVHQNLQAQFKNRTVRKRYIALLSGIIPADKGSIELPLCPDTLNRPRQIVSYEYGKPAVTFYQVLARENGQTCIAFYPQTGRTHQLRVHAAHPQGLNTPITGDELYGIKADRLYLHAEYLAFRHPVTGITIEVEKKAGFHSDVPLPPIRQEEYRLDWSSLNPKEIENMKDELTELWEASVRSTHHFLTEADIQFYKPLVRNNYLTAVQLYLIRNEQNKTVAFMGLSDDMIEMLFVLPDEQGKGYGKQLIDFAVREQHIYKVDVNEQNLQATSFYLNRGFEIVGRDETDPSGNPFPILHLYLKEFYLQGKKSTGLRIRRITDNKKNFLDLLLLADEQESMIDRYLDRGEMFALYKDDSLKSVCVVTDEGNRTFEIKNIATYPQYQKQGYGKLLIQFLFGYYRGKCRSMLVGTGDSPLTIPFYEHCGFTYSHRIPNFFTDNYEHPIFEGGKQLVDMVYLQKRPDEGGVYVFSS